VSEGRDSRPVSSRGEAVEIRGHAPFDAAVVVWQRRGETVATVIAKATYALEPEVCPLLEEPDAIQRIDETWDDQTGRSVRVPSDLAPIKCGYDVLVVGHAHAPKAATRVLVRLVISSIDKSVEARVPCRVSADGKVEAGPPLLRFPLRYEVAPLTAANPVGIDPRVYDKVAGNYRLPQLLPPDLAVKPGQELPFVGLGPIAPTWPTRDSLLRTEDREWLQAMSHKPQPNGFDPNYFTVAPLDQRADAPFRADERLVLECLHPQYPRLTTTLTAATPMLTSSLGGALPELVADTLLIDSDRGIVTLTWRAQLAIDLRRQTRIAVRPRGNSWVNKRSAAISAQSFAQAETHDGEGETLLEALNTTSADGNPDLAAVLPFLTRAPSAPRQSGLPEAGLPFRSAPPAPPSNHRTVPPPPPSIAATSSRTPGATVASATLSAPPSVLPKPSAVGVPLQPPPIAAPLLQAPASVPPQSLPIPQQAAPPLPPPPPAPPPQPLGTQLHPPLTRPPPPIVQQAPMPTPGPSNSAPQASPPLRATFQALESPRREATEPAPFGAAFPSRSKPAMIPSAKSASDGAADRRPDTKLADKDAKTETSVRRCLVDLLWHDAQLPRRLRRGKSFTQVLADFSPPKGHRRLDEAEADRDREDRAKLDVLRVLSCGEPARISDLSSLADEQMEDANDLEIPVFLVSGELRPSFDELAALKAAVRISQPLAANDKRLLSVLAVANEVLAGSSPPSSETTSSLLKQIESATTGLNLPARYVADSVEKSLLETRAYRKRGILGESRIRCDLLVPSATAWPCYVIEEVAQKLPLLPSFPIVALVEVRPREDASEAHSESLLVVALGRVLRRSRL
jgi:hypothetical protein